MSTEQRHLDSRPVLAGGAGDDLELDREEWTAVRPRRFLEAVFDATSGYEGDEKLVTAFPTECHGGPDCRISQVVEGPIPFFSLCEHHSLPFSGKAYVGYIAHERVLPAVRPARLRRHWHGILQGSCRLWA